MPLWCISFEQDACIFNHASSSSVRRDWGIQELYCFHFSFPVTWEGKSPKEGKQQKRKQIRHHGAHGSPYNHQTKLSSPEGESLAQLQRPIPSLKPKFAMQFAHQSPSMRVWAILTSQSLSSQSLIINNMLQKTLPSFSRLLRRLNTTKDSISSTTLLNPLPNVDILENFTFPQTFSPVPKC